MSNISFSFISSGSSSIIILGRLFLFPLSFSSWFDCIAFIIFCFLFSVVIIIFPSLNLLILFIESLSFIGLILFYYFFSFIILSIGVTIIYSSCFLEFFLTAFAYPLVSLFFNCVFSPVFHLLHQYVFDHSNLHF